MLRFFGVGLIVASASAMTWKSCGTENDRLVTSQLTISGKLEGGGTASLKASGTTDLHAALKSGAWQVRVYETGVAKSTSTTVGDLTKAVTFDNPSSPTKFSLALSFDLPKKEATGQFTASVSGTDDQKSQYFCLEVSYSYDEGEKEASTLLDTVEAGTSKMLPSPFWLGLAAGEAARHKGGCKTDADCPSSYCMTKPGQPGPFTCHTCGDLCCLKDSDCDAGYCQNDSTKTPPYFCHASASSSATQAAKTKNLGDFLSKMLSKHHPKTCKSDKDCGRRSYCMSDPTKRPPFYCHSRHAIFGAVVDQVMKQMREKKIAARAKEAAAAAVRAQEEKKVTATGEKDTLFPTYCNANGFCHCPPLPTACKSDKDCKTPWYPSSYCQDSKTCHQEPPPACKKDSDCDRKAATATLVLA